MRKSIFGMRWESDWNGYEVGFPDVPVVSLYTSPEGSYYINAATGKVLEFWPKEDEEEI